MITDCCPKSSTIAVRLHERSQSGLVPSPDTYLAGGDFASLQHQSCGNWNAWGLFTRNFWLDDGIGELVTILDLLAPYVEDWGYGG